MEYFDNKRKVDEYFKKVLEQIRDLKVINVFTMDNASYGVGKEKIIYDTDTELYILLENNKCFIISYLNASLLGIEYRSLNEKELKRYKEIRDKDLFNMVHEIHNPQTMKICNIDSIRFEYSSIVQIEVHGFSNEFETWRNNEEVIMPNGGDYFDRINFCMDNGNKICICPKDAIFDGYLDFWAEGSIEEHKEL